jgi:hypothetical protein
VKTGDFVEALLHEASDVNEYAFALGALGHYKPLPKIGPLRPLAFKVPTPEAEGLFLESLDRTRARSREMLTALRAGRLHLTNVNLNTGRLSKPGEYERADKAEADLRTRTRSAHSDL